MPKWSKGYQWLQFEFTSIYFSKILKKMARQLSIISDWICVDPLGLGPCKTGSLIFSLLPVNDFLNFIVRYNLFKAVLLRFVSLF